MSRTALSDLLVRHRMRVLLLLSAVAYLPCLGLRDMWYPDEPDIAEVCLAMYDSGDWITPLRNGVPWVDYPPLIYWLGCSFSWLLGGMTEFALRLPCALAGIGVVLVTCAAVTRWFDARTGFWSGLILLTLPQFALQATGYRTDMLLTFFLVTGMFVYARAVGERMTWWPRVFAFLLFGVAMLAKGPLGVLLPGMLLTLWHGSRREWRPMFELAPLALISLAVYMPWFAAYSQANGFDNMLYEFYAQNFARFGSGFRGHHKPPHYYFVTFWYDLPPWAFLMPFAVWWLVKAKHTSDRWIQLALWWFFATFLFFTVAATKRQLYLLPAYPAAALLIARWITGLTDPEREAVAPDPRPARVFVVGSWVLFFALAGVAIIGGLAAGPVVAAIEPKEMYADVALAGRLPLIVTGLVFLAVAIWVRRSGEDLSTGLSRAGVALVPVYTAAFCLILPAVNPTKTYAPSGQWIREQIGDQDKFGLVNPDLGFHKQGAFGFYTGGKLVVLLDKVEATEEFLREHPKSVVLVHEEFAEEVFPDWEDAWSRRVIGRVVAGRHPYYVVRGS